MIQIYVQHNMYNLLKMASTEIVNPNKIHFNIQQMKWNSLKF